MKFTSTADTKTTFRTSSQKCSGSIRGRIVHVPYASDEAFDFVIFEGGGTKDAPDKYLGQFCIIPKSVLAERGVLSAESIPGRVGFAIVVPDGPDSHWSKPYWNAWGPLRARAEAFAAMNEDENAMETD
jgi:hypothetical protein